MAASSHNVPSEASPSLQLNGWKRFLIACCACAFVSFTALFIPALNVFTPSNGLIFTSNDVWWVSALFNGIFVVVLAALIALAHGKFFMRVIIFLVCVGIAAFIQVYFLNNGMMPTNGGYIGWNEWYFVRRMIVSGIVWFAILLLPQLIIGKFPTQSHATIGAIALVLVFVQCATLPALMANSDTTDDSDTTSESGGTNEPLYVTQGGLYTVNPQSNVLVFVLDTFDTSLMEDIIATNPAALQAFGDFTYYRNSAGSMVPTPYAIPYMLTGRFPQPDENLASYSAALYDERSFIQTAHDLGYNIGLYTDSPGLNLQDEFDRMLAADTINIHPLSQVTLNVWNAFAVLNQCALYYSAPWIMKPLFCFSNTDVDNRLITQTAGAHGNDALYEYDDSAILATLKDEGLASADDGTSGAFRFIHLLGPHFPYSLDEEGNFIGINESSMLRQAQGSLKVVETYLDELKKLGLYDSATVIVTADHGIWDEREDPLETPASPLLLVKMAGATNGDAPAGGAVISKISDAPVCQADLLPTLVLAMGGSTEQVALYGSGLTFDQIPEGERTRYHFALVNTILQGRQLVEYVIQGDVLDLDNWSPTGNVWPDA